MLSDEELLLLAAAAARVGSRTLDVPPPLPVASVCDTVSPRASALPRDIVACFMACAAGRLLRGSGRGEVAVRAKGLSSSRARVRMDVIGRVLCD